MGHIQELTAYFLREASSKLSSNRCNDVPQSLFETWTLEQKREFVKGYYDWNGEALRISGDRLEEELKYIPDWVLVSYLSSLLTTQESLDEPEEVPVLVGYLKNRWGIVGYKMAGTQTPIFEYKGLYQFTIFKESDNSPLVKTFYKENLKDAIRWIENK